MALRWSSLSPSRRWFVVASTMAGLLLGVVFIRAVNAEPPVPPLDVSNGWVAFTVETDAEHGASDIYLVRPGEPERALIGFTGDHVREACPQFSPDGTQIAYLSGPTVAIPGRDEIRIVTLSIDGVPVGAPRVLAGGLVTPTCPEWSRDSQGVAVTTGRMDIAGQVVPLARTLSVLHLDGSSSVIDVGPSAWKPDSFDWSPVGNEIAYIAPSSIWIAPLDGGAPRHVYDTDGGVDLHRLAWSPDGKRILATAGSYSIMERLPVRIIPIDDWAAPVEIGGFRHVTWSPDGQRFAAVRSTNGGSLDWVEIVTMARDGSDVRVVVDRQWAIQGLAWSPDGSELVYVEDQGPSPGLFAVAASGDAQPRFLLARPTRLFNTTSEDLSWQAVLQR